MKTLLLLAAIVSFYACQSGKKDKPSDKPALNMPRPKDTLNIAVGRKPKIEPWIEQDIWHDGKLYHLQTNLFTDSGQIHPRKGSRYSMSYDTRFVPYSNEISGTFKQIKNMKNSEYQKAKAYSEVPDSISMLESLPIDTGTDEYKKSGKKATGYNRAYPTVTGSDNTLEREDVKDVMLQRNNIIIGQSAGKYLDFGSYCVIVGHDSVHVNIKGKDMIWLVDWDEPYLNQNPDIKEILLDYYNNVIKKGKDSEELRANLAYRIIHREKIFIGIKPILNTGI